MTNKKDQNPLSSENRFESILKEFSKDAQLYYAAEAFLKDGFGIIMRSNNPNSTDAGFQPRGVSGRHQQWRTRRLP